MSQTHFLEHIVLYICRYQMKVRCFMLASMPVGIEYDGTISTQMIGLGWRAVASSSSSLCCHLQSDHNLKTTNEI